MKEKGKYAIIIVCGILIITGLCCLFRKPLKVVAMECIYFVRGDIPEIAVNFNDIICNMKPLHGINNGPKSGYIETDKDTDKWQLDVTELYKSLSIPYVRTHDAEYPYGQDKFIDIHCIFPDFDRDVNDPTAYHFEETDEYVTAIVESGAQVFFRLGESIDHSGEDKYINPPEDYMKWAQICEHIVRHYNEGWANGFHYNIKYWEIWNEPDNSSMWTGSMEQYYELYRITAKYLKQNHPEIRVGGCALASNAEEGIQNFLNSLNKDGNSTPLDFFSWHTYTNNPEIYFQRGNVIRNLLDENGYENTEIILDEWNYLERWDDIEGAAKVINSADGGAFIAASLISMQKGPVDLSMYYDGQFVLTDVWGGLFDSEGKKEPGYYAFDFYNRLYQMGQQVRMNEGLSNFYCCAATTGEKDGMLLVNFNSNDKTAITVRLTINGSRKHAVITRVNNRFPDGVTNKENWLFDYAVINIEAGEMVYIELE